MSRPTLASLRESGHRPDFHRHQRGVSPFGRPVYGYSVSCRCGWSRRINGPKRDAVAAHNDHLREV